MLMRRTPLIWLLLLALTLISLAVATMRLDRLPELPVTLGPALDVRAVRVQPRAGLDVQQFQRGDRVRAVQGKKVEEMRDLRVLLHDVKPSLPPNAKPKGPVIPTISYQIERPVHRFTLMIRDEQRDPAELPAGLEQGDRLVELDGRPLPNTVGIEHIRSILASRPEALLGLERRDAIFSGRMPLLPVDRSRSLMACFLAALALILAFGIWGHRQLAPRTALAVAAETLCFAWVGVLVLHYQWIIADYTLAAIAAIATLLMRPLGIYARTVSHHESPRGSLGALLVGLACAAVVAALLAREVFPSAEVALRFAALVAGLFIIFEVVLTGLNDRGGVTLGERSFYLAGTVLLMVFTCFVAWQIDPIAFAEERWRWFLTAVLALMWFGDALLAIRGIPASPLAELADADRRLGVIDGFLGEVGSLLPTSTMELVVTREGQAVSFRRDGEELVIETPAPALLDAVEILLQEGARVPMSAAERDTNPMAGIADTMRLAVAMNMPPPPHTLDVEGLSVVLLGTFGEEVGEDMFRPSFEEVDAMQHMLDASVWTALLVESLAFWAEHVEAAPVGRAVDAQGADDAEDADDALDEDTPSPGKAPSAAAQAEVDALRAEREHLLRRVDLLQRWYRPAEPAPRGHEQLLEAALLEAIDFLYEDPSPVAISGARGVGKTFVARCAHERDAHVHEGPCVLYDASRFVTVAHRAHLLLSDDILDAIASDPTPALDEDSAPLDDDTSRRREHVRPGATPRPVHPALRDARPPLLEVAQHGTLIIEHAEALGEDTIRDLLFQSHHHPVRLVLTFTEAEAHAHSPLDDMGPDIQNALIERELVIPHFAARAEIKEAVLHELLTTAAHHHRRCIEDFSPSALNALSAYAFPGNLHQATCVLDLATAHAHGAYVEIGDLPMDVRRG